MTRFLVVICVMWITAGLCACKRSGMAKLRAEDVGSRTVWGNCKVVVDMSGKTAALSEGTYVIPPFAANKMGYDGKLVGVHFDKSIIVVDVIDPSGVHVYHLVRYADSKRYSAATLSELSQHFPTKQLDGIKFQDPFDFVADKMD